MSAAIRWLFVACVVGSSAAGAAEPAHQWIHYLGALGTYGFTDSSRAPGAQDASGLEALYGSQRDDGWGYEINGYANLLETGVNNGTDYYRWGAGGDLFYAFRDRFRLTPFALVGVGYGYNDVSNNRDDHFDWTLNAGLGLVTRPLLWEMFRVRGEARYVFDHYGDRVGRGAYGDWILGLGLEFGLTRLRPPPPLVGTLPPPVEKVRIVEVDNGLRDSDGDGILDGKDSCPATSEGTRVDGAGCELPKVLRLNGVTFEFNKSRLRPDARTILKDVVDILQRYPDMKVEIAGHTDSMGTEEYNLKLSQRRADAVRSYLLTQSVGENRVGAVGYGESEPLDTNETDEGREVNRRVEMRIKE
ncbi:MAG TPA: OmpA family protein [Candidatus Binatia bacterium]|nr:OmpA family protein [Candidatus Binatia bacterium]